MRFFSFKSLTALIFIPVLFFLNTEVKAAQAQFVKTIYPGAQIWFEKLSQKYLPQQKGNVVFYISDHCYSDSGAIYWSEDRLKEINKAYLDPKISNDIDNLFKKDEYVFLHESLHVMKSHSAKGYVALALTAVNFAALNGYIATSLISGNNSSWIETIITGAFGNSIIFVSLFKYIQSQEKQADKFANDNGDKQTLQAGIDHFNSYVEKDQKVASLLQRLIDLFNDPSHQSAQSRVKDATQAIEDRFSEENKTN